MVAVEPIVREEVRPPKETPKATQQVTVAPNWIGRRAMPVASTVSLGIIFQLLTVNKILTLL
jgi:hypothetical protein